MAAARAPSKIVQDCLLAFLRHLPYSPGKVRTSVVGGPVDVPSLVQHHRSEWVVAVPDVAMASKTVQHGKLAALTQLVQLPVVEKTSRLSHAIEIARFVHRQVPKGRVRAA